MPSLFKKRRRDDDADFTSEAVESVIPTPSIDLVLQNIASNAIASTSNLDSDRERSADEGTNSNADSGGRARKVATSQITTRAKLKQSQMSANVKNSKNAKGIRPGNGTANKILQNGSRSSSNINGTSMPSNRANFNRRPLKLPITATKSVSSSQSSSRTVSEMLNDLVNRSLNNRPQITAAPDGAGDDDDDIEEIAPPSKRTGNNLQEQLPSLRFIPITSSSSNAVNQSCAAPTVVHQRSDPTCPVLEKSSQERSNVAREERIESFVDAAEVSVSSQNKSVSTGNQSQMRVESAVDAVIAAVRGGGTSSSDTTQTRQDSVINSRLDENGGDGQVERNEEVENVEDGEEGGEEIVVNGEEEEAETPFCKNCASDVPLILKRLDRLDGMVNRLITKVESAISNPSTSSEILIDADIREVCSHRHHRQPVRSSYDNNKQLELELQIMTCSPKQFDLRILFGSNISIRMCSFQQLQSALDSLVRKQYLLKNDTPPSPVMYLKNDRIDASARLRVALAYSRQRQVNNNNNSLVL